MPISFGNRLRVEKVEASLLRNRLRSIRRRRPRNQIRIPLPRTIKNVTKKVRQQDEKENQQRCKTRKNLSRSQTPRRVMQLFLARYSARLRDAEVAEASKSCEIDVYLRPPGVPPFTFHTGLTDKRTDDLIRRARFKAAGVIRKWQQIKFNAIKDNMENTPLQATSYYGFYSSTMQNSQGTLSAMQPNMPPSPRGGGQGGGGGGAGMHTITPFHAQQTPPLIPIFLANFRGLPSRGGATAAPRSKTSTANVTAESPS